MCPRTNELTLLWVAGPWPGRLAIVPRSRGLDLSLAETDAWRKAGLDEVFLLLEPEETSRAVFDDKPVAADAADIAIHSFAVTEHGRTASMAAVAQLGAKVVAALKAGRTVSAHCHYGPGRSGLIAGAILVVAGIDLQAVPRVVAKARKHEFPESRAQRRWLGKFAVWLSARTSADGSIGEPEMCEIDMRLLQYGGGLIASSQMDKDLEHSHKDKILRRLGHLLPKLGFRRTQPRYFARVAGQSVEFVHVHKYTFAPAFRVHLGVAGINDTLEGAALNGPDSVPFEGEGFDLSFDESDESIDACAAEIARFVHVVAEPWFASRRGGRARERG